MEKLHPAVKAIIQKGDKFLVIKQVFENKIYWDLPGGKVDFGENPYDTLTREVMEEVHLVVRIIKPAGLFWFFRHDGDQVICATFLCETENYEIDLEKNPIEDENISEYRWVTKEEFLKGDYPVGHESLKDLVGNL